MHPILFHLGFLNIYSYGFLIAIGLFFSSYLFLKKVKIAGYDTVIFENLIFYIFIFGIIGARVLYVLLNWNFYSHNIVSIIKIWEGGLVFWGGFIAAFVTAVILFRKHKYEFLDIADIFAPFLALGHAFGRIGCFMAGCCYGKPTNSIFGFTFTNEKSLAPLNISLHPTQLYESVMNFILFYILLKVLVKRRFKGQVLGLYLIFYSIFRFFIEFFRGDDRGKFFMFSVTQLICFLLMAMGVIILYYGNKRKNIFYSK